MSKAILFPVIAVMTMMGSLGGFYFKRCSASGSLGPRTLLNPNLYIGGVFYVLSALVNIWVLHYMEYSVLMPMLGITYIWSLILSCLFLHEKFTARKLIGIGIIVAGAALIGIG